MLTSHLHSAYCLTFLYLPCSCRLNFTDMPWLMFILCVSCIPFWFTVTPLAFLILLSSACFPSPVHQYFWPLLWSLSPSWSLSLPSLALFCQYYQTPANSGRADLNSASSLDPPGDTAFPLFLYFFSISWFRNPALLCSSHISSSYLLMWLSAIFLFISIDPPLMHFTLPLFPICLFHFLSSLPLSRLTYLPLFFHCHTLHYLVSTPPPSLALPNGYSTLVLFIPWCFLQLGTLL